MTVESALGILARYHHTVNQATYVKRKRGNPRQVLDAVTFLRGSSACVLCGHTGRTELHHTDGNWRNYTLDNLRYHCKACHLMHHKLLEMHTMAKQITFTDAMYTRIRTAVDAGARAGKTKAEMFGVVGAKFNIAAKTCADRYYNSPDTLRAKRRESNAKSYARKTGKTSPVQKTGGRVSQVHGGVQVMSVERAIGMLQAAEQFGVSSKVSITFLS